MPIHLYGVITKQDGQWWLAQFPELDTQPSALFQLDEQLTPGLTEWLQTETGLTIRTIDKLGENGETCWCGEFSIVPAPGSDRRYQLDAHPWGSNPTLHEKMQTIALIHARSK